MKRLCALALLASLHAGAAGAQVAPPVANDLSESLARLKADVATPLIARQFGDAYVRDWWAATEMLLADAVRQSGYVGEQGPECLTIRARDGDKSSAWVTCSIGIEEAAKLLSADLAQIATILPDWERMARQIDTANATVSPLVDRALAAISETEKRL
ncbi:MAG: hypothetical protein HY059_00655, partial [Proteobacteria bacterium]|nr:hypothetical protein [Pseudomonadota bacterium]